MFFTMLFCQFLYYIDNLQNVFVKYYNSMEFKKKTKWNKQLKWRSKHVKLLMWHYFICVRFKNMQIKLRQYNVSNKSCHVVEEMIYKTTIWEKSKSSKFSWVIYEILSSSYIKVKENPHITKVVSCSWLSLLRSGSEFDIDNLNSVRWTITVPYIEGIWNKAPTVIVLVNNIIIWPSAL